MRSCDPNTSVDPSELFISNLSMLMIGISDIRPMRVRPLSKHCCVHRPQLRCWLPALKSSDLDSQQQRPPGSDRSRKTFATSCHLEFSILQILRKKKEILSVSSVMHNQPQPCNITLFIDTHLRHLRKQFQGLDNSQDDMSKWHQMAPG